MGRRLLKKTTRQYITVAIICVLVIGIAAISATLMFCSQVKRDFDIQITKAHEELAENQRVAYVATMDLAPRDIISKDNVKRETIFSSQSQDTYLTEEDIGKVMLIKVTKGTALTTGMTSDDGVDSELRELEYNSITINSNIISNDTVDVRIVYPNGESYVVLSKKVIKGIMEESTSCYFWLDEDEILRMSAAIVDASLYTGAQLLTSKYIEPSIQDASKVTYTPSVAILSLIESDPNIVDRSSQKLNKTVRKSLENRLASSLNEDVTTKDWNVSEYQFNNPNAVSGKDGYINEDAKTEVVTPTPTEKPEQESGDLGSSGSNEDNAELGDARTDNYLYYAKEGELN